MAKSKAATGRTRWKRFGVALIPAFAVISGMGVAAASGAIPMGFAISGTTFKVSADEMRAYDVVQYGSLTNPQGPNSKPVILSGFSRAEFDNLCQSVKVPLPFSIAGKNSVVMVIKSPEAKATNMVADLAQMTGKASFENVAIGIDAAVTSKGPIAGENLPAPMREKITGAFAQQVDKVTVQNARQTVYSVSAGQFNLSHLDISVNFNNTECF
jgi:hypothetical protein